MGGHCFVELEIVSILISQVTFCWRYHIKIENFLHIGDVWVLRSCITAVVLKITYLLNYFVPSFSQCSSGFFLCWSAFYSVYILSRILIAIKFSKTYIDKVNVILASNDSSVNNTGISAGRNIEVKSTLRFLWTWHVCTSFQFVIWNEVQKERQTVSNFDPKRLLTAELLSSAIKYVARNVGKTSESEQWDNFKSDIKIFCTV
jgi:hypothetical protein